MLSPKDESFPGDLMPSASYYGTLGVGPHQGIPHHGLISNNGGNNEPQQ